MCFSVNYSKVEEDRKSEWSGIEKDFEVKPLGIAAYVGNIPAKYFSGYEAGGMKYDMDDVAALISFYT